MKRFLFPLSLAKVQMLVAPVTSLREYTGESLKTIEAAASAAAISPPRSGADETAYAGRG